LNKQFETRSPEETLSLGEKIGRHLAAGDIVCLFGDLGAGKTTLTQGIARGLGVPKKEYVRSPTFTLVNQYEGKLPVFHIDLYRLASVQDLEDLGLEETLDHGGVTIVEWAEKLFDAKQPETPLLGMARWLEIHIRIEPDETRKFELRALHMGPAEHPVFTLH
jgi:tRNA threonylcarbamoyladenosine biosynthesis protein TsaE